MAGRNIYDPRVRELIRATGDPNLFRELNIPRSTVAGWLRGQFKPAIGTAHVSQSEVELHIKIAKLERRIAVLHAVVRLLLTLVRVSGMRLNGARLPGGQAKVQVLEAINAVSKTLPLKSALKIVGLSGSRFHAWERSGVTCQLDDRSSCPRTFPSQLTPSEARAIKDMVTSTEYRHMPITTLALYAKRVGRAFASASTWARLVRERGWRRPRLRVYPPKPRVGLRASFPNEYWHIDLTIIRLLDGTRLFLHAVLDNFSRRILAWRLADTVSPTTTCELLNEALKDVSGRGEDVSVVTDGGSENVNGDVDALLESNPLQRVLAQVDIIESNSMIEAWWRSLRQQWLYLNTLDTEATVRRLVAFYVKQHNEVMPHSALGGRTPDGVYFARDESVPNELAGAHRRARERRLIANRELSCGTCPSRAALGNAA